MQDLFKRNNYLQWFIKGVCELIYCVTATSLASENLFRNSGLVQNDQRNRMEPSALNVVFFTPLEKNDFQGLEKKFKFLHELLAISTTNLKPSADLSSVGRRPTLAGRSTAGLERPLGRPV
ncbi:hypothetical protein BpHYR1_009916 [Brachionus plicatilis]|uniref:Uncharacterized protein n=1 Tax=Brachionus plicatilis TaxID=10195 RepID=A0A3M7QNA0_BRAPC|nr:hypothetical protein BpHYR1_009916 [Brachionus plicatilis]